MLALVCMLASLATTRLQWQNWTEYAISYRTGAFIAKSWYRSTHLLLLILFFVNMPLHTVG